MPLMIWSPFKVVVDYLTPLQSCRQQLPCNFIADFFAKLTSEPCTSLQTKSRRILQALVIEEDATRS